MFRTKRGQITIVNLLMLFIVLVLYLLCFLPVLNTIITDAIPGVESTGGDFATIEVLLLRMIPFFLLLAILMTAFIYAIPRREGEVMLR